jgi:1-acyl-sn-glycerol-3-phosphate acyltransferase
LSTFTLQESARPKNGGGLFRGIVLMIFLIPWTVPLATICLIAGFIKVPAMYRFGVQLWAEGVLFVAGTRLKIHYDEPLDTSKLYVFLCNHQSALDIPALITATKRTHDIRFMAKESLFKIPFLGWAIARNGYVPIRRESAREAAEKFKELLKTKDSLGFSYLIFPEGTRSDDGRLQPLKRGTLGLALRLGMPVVPVTIVDACRANPKSSYQMRSGDVHVVFHKPIAIPEDGGDREMRDKLLDEVYEAIRLPLPDDQQPVKKAGASEE